MSSEVKLPKEIDTNFIEWILKNKLKNELGQAIEFKEHLFMLEPYANFFPQQVTMKSAQVGWSTEAIVKSFYMLKECHFNVIYTLPTVEDVRDFVPAKVDLMVSNNPYLVSLLGKSDAMTKKQLGNNYIFYRGTSGKKAAIMHTSDVNFYDEYDSCDWSVIDLYTSRLQRSKYQGEQKFSNPTRPGGIDAQYELSDQRRWRIKCSKCGKDQALDYFKNVCQERAEYICAHCNEVLREEDRCVGRWVPDYPSRSNMLHGYHINQLMAPWVTAKKLILLEKTKGNDYFYNMVLGLPFVDSNERVDRDSIVRCFRNTEGSRLRNAMGVDVKLNEKHYVLGNKDGVFKVGVARTWEEIEALIEQYNPFTVIDANPDFYPRRTMIKKYPGKVFCCIYKQNPKKRDLIRWLSGDERGFVHVDRNEMIQHCLDLIYQQKVRFNIGMKPAEVVAESEYKDFIKHFENMYKVTRVGRLNIEESIWEHKGPDDFVHAFSYFNIAMDKVREDSESMSGLPLHLLDVRRFAPEILDDRIPAERIPIYQEPVASDDWIYN